MCLGGLALSAGGLTRAFLEYLFSDEVQNMLPEFEFEALPSEYVDK
jgi:hypothetical protein